MCDGDNSAGTSYARKKDIIHGMVDSLSNFVQFFFCKQIRYPDTDNGIDGGGGYAFGNIDNFFCLKIVAILRIVSSEQSKQCPVQYGVDGGCNGWNKVAECLFQVVPDF